MSTRLAARPEQSTPEGEGSAPRGRLPAPKERGATLIPAKVVARVTARAAREALREQTDDSLARLGLGVSDPAATVHQGSARIAVSPDLPYPVDIARACDEIQHYITERVSHLTGLSVGDTTVSVQRLVPDESREGRVR